MPLPGLNLAIRTLRRNPGFTVPALLTLALGIGVNTAMFSIVDAIMLRPLPFRDPDRLAYVWTQRDDIPVLKGRKLTASAAQLERWAQLSRSFESLGGYRGWRVSVTGAGEPERRYAMLVTGDLLRVLGYTPALGRAFEPSELRSGAGRVALIGHAYWKTRFGGDRGVLGRSISLDGYPHTIIGVMPPSASPVLPDTPRTIDIWASAYLDFTVEMNKAVYCSVVGRLRPGVGIAQAGSEMRAIMDRIRGENRRWAKTGVGVTPLRDDVAADLRTAALVLFGAVGCVLLIATVNIANLLLARSAARQRETGIRAVLGAGRVRLVRQMLVESGVVGLAGGALGLALSHWVVKGIVALWPGSVERFGEIRLDATVLLFALGASLVTGLLFGLLPAIQASRPDLSVVIRDTGTQGRRRRGMFAPANLLVVGEVTLAVMLLVGAGLLLRTFAAMRGIHPGFQTARVVVAPIPIVGTRYENPAATVAFARNVLERLQAHPQIEHAGFTNSVPLYASYGVGADFKILGRPPLEGNPSVNIRAVTPDYFRAIGIPLRAGRFLRDGDGDAIVINDAMARQFFGRENPVGARIETMDCKACTIVGVVADLKNRRLTDRSSPEVYLPLEKEPGHHLDLVVRTRQDPTHVISAVRAELRAADPSLAPEPVKTMEEILSLATATPRFYAVLLGAFAALATLLAAVGIFGVISYSVTQRTKEFGVRMALGAGRSAVVGTVVKHALVLAGAGVAFGLGAAFAATRVLRSLLYGVAAHDAATFAAVGVLVLSVAAAAAWNPARRATRVDPMTALRYE